MLRTEAAEKVVYFIGIIDILQQFTIAKALAHAAARFLHPETLVLRSGKAHLLKPADLSGLPGVITF